MPKRRRYLFVCTNSRPEGTPKGSCARRGSVELQAKLKRLVKEAGLDQLEVRPCTSGCLDLCWAGPVIAVEPDNYFYGRFTDADLPEIVEALKSGLRVERLVLPPSDFDDPADPPA